MTHQFLMGRLFLLLCIISGSVTQAMSLNEYLTEISKRNHGLQSLESFTQAAQGRKAFTEINYATYLKMSHQQIDDQKPQAFGSIYSVDRSKVAEYSVGLAKKFKTGTQASVTGTAGQMDLTGRMTGASFENTSGYSNLGINLTQSLWKNSFGATSRAEVNRAETQSQTEVETYRLQTSKSLIDYESLFWEYLLSRREIEVRKQGLDRAKKIESWVKRRVNNGIGDRADLLNAQGLLETRELQLRQSQDQFSYLEKLIRTSLELSENEKLPILEGDLTSERKMLSMVTIQGQGKILRYDAYLSGLEARIRHFAAEEQVDSVRPDLSLYAGYKTNGIESNLSSATNKMTDGSKPTTQIGITLTMPLDGQTKREIQSTARAEALAAEAKKSRMKLESETAWTELNRRHQELSKIISSAKRIQNLQTQRAAVERDKLTKGRTVTSQVITAEQEADEASLALVRLNVEHRKMEAQAKMFIRVQESL